MDERGRGVSIGHDQPRGAARATPGSRARDGQEDRDQAPVRPEAGKGIRECDGRRTGAHQRDADLVRTPSARPHPQFEVVQYVNGPEWLAARNRPDHRLERGPETLACDALPSGSESRRIPGPTAGAKSLEV